MAKRGVPFPQYTPTKPSTAIREGSKRTTHFSLQSPGVSPGLGAHSTPYSQASSPSHSRRLSRASLGALRSALQQYHVPSEDDFSPLKNSHQQKSSEGPGMDVNLGAGDEYMDAMVEIHRVLYRGREEMNGKTPDWSVQGPEVQRVVERWFEADCTYDHPYLRLSSRQALLAHFVLLHLISTAYLPSPTPSSLLHHARNVTLATRRMLLGGDIRERDLESGSRRKGVQLPLVEEEWMGLADKQIVSTPAQRSDDDRWWTLWNVSADCTEIGGMETYDGYHLGLIEHVVTLTLFPSLSRRRSAHDGLTSPSASSVSTLDLSPPSFTSRLASALADEFDTLLHWDLPISTVVHFNEVGKATHVRDTVDVRDVVEAVVPFAKRFGWLARRVIGLLCSTLGLFVLAVIPGPKVTITPPIKLAGGVKSGTGLKPVPAQVHTPPRPFGGGSSDESNTLGLEGVAGPDI